MDEGKLEKRDAIPALGFYPREPISTGTTLIAVEFDGGVVFGTDSRTSGGSYIASRATDKITPITSHMSVLRSGSAADTQTIADISKYYLEVYSLQEQEPLTIYRSAQILRKYLFNYRDELSASMIIGGWDKQESGQIYAIPLGGYITRQHCTASGSGSTYVQGFLDSQWKPGMTLQQVQELVRTAVGLAAFRDGSSGGVIRLAVIDKDGTKRQLFRPDQPNYPTFNDPPAYPTFPKHIIQTLPA
ncbi:PBS-1 protein [Aphelenchoides avenae]|nr:PBS-1 protein [Aphelenchus avenae]